MNWLDLHPGWRYVRLVNAIRDDEWLEGADESVPRLQWKLSSRLGWPAPLRFLELGASLADATAQIGRHAAAVRLRLEEPDHLLWTGDDDADRIAGLFATTARS